jgi:uncharacterized LabA/DUF88 family protein
MPFRVRRIALFIDEPSMVADELRRQADAFVDLQQMEFKIGREAADMRMSTSPG